MPSKKTKKVSGEENYSNEVTKAENSKKMKRPQMELRH